MTWRHAVILVLLGGALGACGRSDTAKHDRRTAATVEGVATTVTPQMSHGDSARPPQPAQKPEDVWSQIRATQSRMNEMLQSGRMSDMPALVADLRELVPAMARAAGDTTAMAPQLADVRRITGNLVRAASREDIRGAHRLYDQLDDRLRSIHDATVQRSSHS